MFDAHRGKMRLASLARCSLPATVMKLALYPLIVTALAALSMLLTKTATASPRRGSFANAQEDALADGDVDPEDIVARGAPGSAGTRTTPGVPWGSAWLSVVGFSRRTLDERREQGGFIILGLPLDRFAAGRSSLTDISQVTNIEHVAAIEQPFEMAISTRLARECVSAAWRAAGLGVDDARLDSIISRARWSAMLPEARLRAVRFEDAQLSLDTSTDTSKLRDSAGANVGFEARLTWRFDRLLYADDEPAFERIRLEQRDARTRVASKVLEVLFHWQRAALDLRSLPPAQQGTRDEAEVRLRLLEAEALLDVLTNGHFRPRRPGAGAEYAAPVPLVRGPANNL